MFRSLVIVGLCAAGAVGCLFALRELPYSTSLITHSSLEPVSAAPGAVTTIGSLTWDYGAYQEHPALQPFRERFAPCGDKRGLDAARCMSQMLLERSHRGDPTSEFVDPGYSPANDLKAHFDQNGPGHCMTYSALVATGLLSMGIPARVVQLHADEGGHNIISVWDGKSWVGFDPSVDAVLADESGEPASIAELSTTTKKMQWAGPRASGAFKPEAFQGHTVSLPEPWLYTRVGERCAPRPYHGCFVTYGPVSWDIGPAQWAVTIGALGFTLAGAFIFIRALVLRLRGVKQAAQGAVTERAVAS